jgi:hypothetical protein
MKIDRLSGTTYLTYIRSRCTHGYPNPFRERRCHSAEIPEKWPTWYDYPAYTHRIVVLPSTGTRKTGGKRYDVQRPRIHPVEFCSPWRTCGSEKYHCLGPPRSYRHELSCPRLQYAPHWNPFPTSIGSNGAQTARRSGLDHHENRSMVRQHLFDVHPLPNRRSQRRPRCTHGYPRPLRERRCYGAVNHPQFSTNKQKSGRAYQVIPSYQVLRGSLRCPTGGIRICFTLLDFPR